MTTFIYLIFAVAAIGGLYMLVRVLGGTYLKYRGTRVITCPENREYAAVNVAAKDAAISATLGKHDIHLKACSRWPEKMGCGQECLKKIEASPEDCLFNSIIKNWYEGKSCVFCRKPIGEINWKEYKPALLSPDKKTIEWNEIAPEKVYEVLSTYKPVCIYCHITETFRRQHPELVIDVPNNSGKAQRELWKV